MPSFSSSSMIQLSSSVELEADKKEGGVTFPRPSLRGPLRLHPCPGPGLRVLPGATLSSTPRPPWHQWPGLTEIPQLGMEVVPQRPKDQPQLLKGTVAEGGPIHVTP